MFEDSSVLVICADGDSTIMRIEIDADTQKSICHTFAEAVQSLTSDKEKVEKDVHHTGYSNEIHRTLRITQPTKD